MDMDTDDFYAELSRRMNMPNEDSREYLQRLYAIRREITILCSDEDDVTESAVGERPSATSTCNPRDETSEYIRSDSRDRVKKRSSTPPPAPVAKRTKTSALQAGRDHLSANIQPPDFFDSNIPALSSSPLNRNAEADCPQPREPSAVYNGNSCSFENDEGASSYRYAAAVPEHGETSTEKANVHDTIINSSPEPVRDFNSDNSKKVGDSYPQKSSRTRSSRVASDQSPEPLSPITSFRSTANVSAKDLLPMNPIVAKPEAIALLPLHDPKTKRSVRSKARVKTTENGAGAPPSSPIEDPSTSSIRLKSEPSLYNMLLSRTEPTNNPAQNLKCKSAENSEKEVRRKNAIAPVRTSKLIGENSRSSTSDKTAQKRPKVNITLSGKPQPGRKFTLDTIPDKGNSRVLAHEYAQLLMNKVNEKPLTERRRGKLDGKTIFYVAGEYKHSSETTRRRMKRIIQYGGSLAPKFDPCSVTHIVVASRVSLTVATEEMGLKHWKEIPDHIPTVTWNWVIEDERPICWYAAFAERINAGSENEKPGPTKRSSSNRQEGSSKGKATNSETPQASALASGAVSACDMNSELDHETPASPRRSPAWVPPSPESPDHRATGNTNLRTLSPPPSISPLPLNDKDDPLAEFYAQALAEHDAQAGGRPGEEESDNDEEDNKAPIVNPAPKRGWTCDQKREQIKNCPNQDVIDKLEELKNVHDVKQGQDERWRVYSYSIPALRSYPKRITSFEEARKIRGVGDKTAQKIMEIIETGNLRRIAYETTEDVQVTRLFMGIYGVGQKAAHKWYAAGCRTLDDLKIRKGGVKLSRAQQIGLKFYDDINDRMPRAEAKAIFDLIKPIALSIDSGLFVEIMGSYRRGKADCGDIDILITRKPEDNKTHAGVLSRLLRELRKVGIITEDLVLREHSDDLEAIYRGLCRLPTRGSKRRRIDFLTVPWESRGAALLYYTGDDIFNRAIRMKANKLGYSLNQRGLFKDVIRDPRDGRVKLDKGTLCASETEQEIFKVLGVPWQEPHERIRR